MRRKRLKAITQEELDYLKDDCKIDCAHYSTIWQLTDAQQFDMDKLAHEIALIEQIQRKLED
jgi:hypothetical protein